MWNVEKISKLIRHYKISFVTCFKRCAQLLLLSTAFFKEEFYGKLKLA